MDILDILLDILLKPPQPLMGLFSVFPTEVLTEELTYVESTKGAVRTKGGAPVSCPLKSPKDTVHHNYIKFVTCQKIKELSYRQGS